MLNWDSEYGDKQGNSTILWRIEIIAGLDGGVRMGWVSGLSNHRVCG